MQDSFGEKGPKDTKSRVLKKGIKKGTPYFIRTSQLAFGRIIRIPRSSELSSREGGTERDHSRLFKSDETRKVQLFGSRLGPHHHRELRKLVPRND